MRLGLSVLIVLSCMAMTAQAADWAYQGSDPGYTKYASDNIRGDAALQQVYTKRFYSKFSADINPNYNFSTGVLVRNGQAWVISNDAVDSGNWYSPIVATKFDWATGNTLSHSNLPGYGYAGSPYTFHPNECSGELDTNHCNFPALWAPDGRIYARRGGDQRCLGAMDPATGTWTMLPKDGNSPQGDGYDTPASFNYYNNNLIYHGGYAGSNGIYGFAVSDISAAAWTNGTQGQFRFNLSNTSPTYSPYGAWTINCRREGDTPKAAANMAVVSSYSTNPTGGASTMYVTATNLVTGAQAWTKNYATDTCGQTGTRDGGTYSATSDYWRYIASEDGKYMYYVRNGGTTTLHVDNIATGQQICTVPLAANSDPLMSYNNNYIYVGGAKEQMKIDATTGAVIWRQTNQFNSDKGYTLTQFYAKYSMTYIDPLYRPVVLTNDTMWWVDGSSINYGHLIGMSTTDGTIVQNIDLAAMVTAKNANERLVAVNDVMDANGQLGVLVDIGDVTDPNYISGVANKVKYQDLYLFGFPLPGDANRDGRVTFADYILLELNFAHSGGWSEGDFDGNGIVNFKDYILLEANFGKSVPEPATLGLLLAGGLALLRRKA